VCAGTCVLPMPNCVHSLELSPRPIWDNNALRRYDVWRVRVRGGAEDPEASDSEPDEQVHPSLHDDKLICVLGAIPDECTRKQVFFTSGHSLDHIRILLEGLRPGSRHRVQLRARNTRGLGPWTDLSEPAKCACT
jgi:hypothetical protein